MNKSIVHFCAFIVYSSVVCIMAYYAFVTASCLLYPWWVGVGSDGDGTYLTQTLLLINNGPLELVFHPGASAYSILGIILRIWGITDPSSGFLNLAMMQHPNQVFEMLNHSMHISRVVIFMLNVVCLGVFWRILYMLSHHIWVSLGLASFFMTTYFMLEQRVFILRPEIFSFIFCLLLFWLLLQTFQKQNSNKWKRFASMILVGFLAGMAILAKIQIAPMILCLLLWWIIFSPVELNKAIKTKLSVVTLFVAALNLAIMPWGWMKRPEFLLEYLKNLYYKREEHQLFGSAPETYAGFYLGALLIILILSLCNFFFKDRFSIIVQLILFKVNVMITGLIIALYFVFAWLGQSFTSYVAASNYLLYTISSMVLNGGGVNHRVIDGLTFKAILDVHANNQILGIGILWYVAAGIGLCCFRLLQGLRERKQYIAILGMFFLGIGMDILSTFRQYSSEQVIIVASYAIYSLSAHVCGFALLFAVEIKQQIKWGFIIQKIVSTCLMINIIFIAIHVVRLPKWNVKEYLAQTPQQEMLNTMSAVPGFWRMASQGRLK